VKLIVGLGNPGSEYTATRHNAGFLAVDALARRHAVPGSMPRSKFHAGLLDAHIAGDKCFLMQPTTYMNRSGMAVAEAIRFYQLDPAQDLMVLVDDVALPCGTIRLRARGSAGGHNGLGDIQQKLGTDTYARCRIGIDPPGRVAQHDYVLGRFTPEQRPLVQEAVEKACDAVECWVEHGIEQAMNEHNKRITSDSSNEKTEGQES
jgi:peptidyl-tRNA hydrolase, PTH1 family